MSFGYTTPIQEKLLEPFSQRLYSGDIDYSKSYIYNYFNDLTRIIGEDLVVKGFDVNSVSHTGNTIIVNINPGYIIHDKSFIQVDQMMTLQYPHANAFDSIGKFVVFTRYKNYLNHEENKLRVGMVYIDSVGISFGEFNSNMDRVILAVYSFTKDGSNNIDSITSETGPVIIDGQSFDVYPFAQENAIESSVDGGIIP